MHRRAFLQSASAVIACVVVAPAVAFEAAPIIAKAAPLPAWTVGTPGESNWDIIRAPTKREAIEYWKEEQFGVVCDCDKRYDWACEGCSTDVEADRCKGLDDMDVIAGEPEWFTAGLACICARCEFETDKGNGGRVVGSEIVCEDCMTVDDWGIVDPERAAEMQAENQG